VSIPVPSLTQALEQALRNESDTWDNSSLHVSDLSVGLSLDQGGTCHRQLWLRLQGYEKKEPSIGQRLMWDNGKRIELRANELASEVLEQQGWQLLYSGDKRVELPGGIIGAYDALLIDESGTVLVMDNKTVRGNAFNYMNEARESNVIQVQGYIKALDAHGGVLWYKDREGQNRPLEFFVPRDDDAVDYCADVAITISEMSEPPYIISPQVSLKENKNSVSIVAKERWQCSYCDYQDISCKGALPYDWRSKGGKVVGHIKDGEVVLKEECQEIEPLVEAVQDLEPEGSLPF